MRRLKILQVAPYYPPYLGGQEIYVQNLSEKLAERGHSVTVYTSDSHPKVKLLEIEKNNVYVYRYKTYMRIMKNPITPTMYRDLRKHIGEFDVVHAHNEHTFQAMMVSIIKSEMNIRVPVVLGIHGQLRFATLFKDFIERIYRWSVGRYIYKTVDRIITLSHADKDFIRRHGISGEKIEVIPNGIDLRKINSLASKARDKIDLLLEKYQLNKYRFKILFVGPVVKRKGIDIALKALFLLRRSISNVVLIVTGSGNFLGRAMKMAGELGLGENVLFTNRIPYIELLAFYQIADLVILPSRSEGLPTTLLEALALDKKVIASSLPAIKEYFYNKIPLVECENPNALYIAIKSTLTGSLKYKKINIKRFDWNVVSRKIENVYNRLIK